MLYVRETRSGKFQELSGTIDTEEELQRVADALDKELSERLFEAQLAGTSPRLYLVAEKGHSTVIGVGIGTYVSILIPISTRENIT